jgi:hypothetical protein
VALVVAVLFVALVAAERFGRGYAEHEIAARLQEGGVTGDVDVTVGGSWWRPAVLPALVTGDLDRVTIDVRDGTLSGMPVERTRYVLEGIHGDVSVLNGTVAVRSIDSGSVLVRISPDVIARSLSTDVRARGDELVAGNPPSPLKAYVVGDDLVFSGRALADRGRPQTLPVGDPYLLPCSPGVAVADGALELSCTGDRLPGVLKVPLQGSEQPAGSAPVDTLSPPQSTVRGGG